MNRKVIIDTNVLVSALLSSRDDSATVIMLMLLLDGHIISVITGSSANMEKSSDGRSSDFQKKAYLCSLMKLGKSPK